MTYFTVTALCLASALAMPAAAQYSRPAAPPGMSVRAITEIINNCENRTDDFRKSLRRAINDSALNNSSREATLRRRADQLERALDRTGDSWNRDKDLEKTKRYVREALEAGRDINVTIRNWRLDSGTEREWSILRVQLNALARAFRLTGIR
jgi:hypothetical protein